MPENHKIVSGWNSRTVLELGRKDWSPYSGVPKKNPGKPGILLNPTGLVWGL